MFLKLCRFYSQHLLIMINLQIQIVNIINIIFYDKFINTIKKNNLSNDVLELYIVLLPKNS